MYYEILTSFHYVNKASAYFVALLFLYDPRHYTKHTITFIHTLILQFTVPVSPTKGGTLEIWLNEVDKPVSTIRIQAKDIPNNTNPAYTTPVLKECQEPTTTKLTTVVTTTKQEPKVTTTVVETTTVRKTTSAAGITTKESVVVTTKVVPITKPQEGRCY